MKSLRDFIMLEYKMLKSEKSSGLVKGSKVQTRKLHDAYLTSNRPNPRGPRDAAQSRNWVFYAAAEV